MDIEWPLKDILLFYFFGCNTWDCMGISEGYIGNNKDRVSVV
jgi:hypothetical protein